MLAASSSRCDPKRSSIFIGRNPVRAGPRRAGALADHPGIVREVSSALARHRVSIDELHTEVRPGSMTGEPLFTAQAIVILPTGLTTEELRTELERIGNDVMVDLALTESDNAKAD
jgi:predicted amino acid-binding ACT domain protein